MSPNSNQKQSGSSSGSNDGNIMAKVSQKLGDLSLKKNRLLGEGFYERYSLPASRTQSYEVGAPVTAGASVGAGAGAGAGTGTGTGTGTGPNTSNVHDSGPNSPSNSKSFFSSSPAKKSPLSSPRILPQDKLTSVNTASLAKSAQVKSHSPVSAVAAVPPVLAIPAEPAASSPPAPKQRASASFLSSVPNRTNSGDLSNTTSKSSDGGSNTPSVSASPVSTTVSQPQQGSHKAKFEFTSADISRESSNDSSPNLSAFPSPDHNDPYARSKRPPQVVNPKEIAPRFVFSKKKNRSSNSIKTSSTSTDYPLHAYHNHHSSSLKSVIGHTLSHSGNNSGDESSSGGNGSGSGLHKSHGSMLELKRFFKPISKKSKSGKSSSGGAAATAPARPSSLRHDDSSANLDKSIPFMEEGFKKYGKLGRVLGSGAGGSVRLMKRSSDGTVFAVKEFRLRHANESEREYAKKVTAEFCIGSTLHHPNVIETLDIIHEEGRYFEVMEYCPFDFFAIVMSGKMSTNEIGCCFKQILCGVQYLHDMGLAHRDLKLDNCVVTEQGLIKLIDFGSSSVFRYPFEADIVLAHGVVGSDPYLAPEVLSRRDYDPRPSDIWSVAIIFCCMTLRRFPWKAPHHNDNSYRLFSSKPDGPVGAHGEPLITVEKRRATKGTGSNSSSTNTSSTTNSSNTNTTANTNTNANTNTSTAPSTTSTTSTAPTTAGTASHGPVIKPNAGGGSNATNSIVNILNASDPSSTQPNNGPQQSVIGNAAATGKTTGNNHNNNSHQTTSSARSTNGNNHSLDGPPPPPVIKGPWRLLRLLHHESRPIIGHMLKIDAKQRATLEDIMADPWIQSLSMCTIGKAGEFVKATNHEHTFVPAEQAHLESYKK